MAKKTPISGFVRPEFEPVQQAFAENFEKRKELGAACCICYPGEKFVYPSGAELETRLQANQGEKIQWSSFFLQLRD